MDIYEVNRISKRLIVFGERLSGFMINAMALVIGDEKAALIDTGLGVTGDLDQFVRRYTSLPIVLLATHGDPDHIGCATLFNTIYMSSKDDELLPWATSFESRLGDLPAMSQNNIEICNYAKEHMVKSYPFAHNELNDGDIFDLGGVTLEAIAVPGHSMGSMCFINRRDKYVLTGDAINPFPWLFLERCTGMKEYIEALQHFIMKTTGEETLYCGHSIQKLDKNVVSDLMMGAEEILAGKTENDPPFIVPYALELQEAEPFVHSFGGVTITYDRKKK